LPTEKPFWQEGSQSTIGNQKSTISPGLIENRQSLLWLPLVTLFAKSIAPIGTQWLTLGIGVR
jgi:hypothetical protein